MTKKQRSVLLAVITLVLCLALVAGGTYALFSDQVKMNHHLQAGTLDITLERIGLKTKELDPDTGYMKETTLDLDEAYKDFSDPNEDENVFGITEDTLIVPQSSYAATMKITNNTDVAFGYWIEIKLDLEGEHELSDEELAALRLDEQIKVYVNDEEQAITLNQGLFVGNKANPISKLAKVGNQKGLPSSETFVVCVLFEDLDDDVNNLAKGQELYFDLIVHAVQLTEEAPTP